MSKKCIPIMVLFVFLHYLAVGCTKTIMVQPEKLSAETTECCVREIVLITGEKYELEYPGGQYAAISRLITGTLNDGRKFYLDLTNKNINEIRISTEQTISRVELARNPDQTIYEIMVGDKIYTFGQNGGRVESEVETVHGITTTGVEIDVPIEDIASVKVKREDANKTGAAMGFGVFGVIVLVVVAAIAISAATYPK